MTPTAARPETTRPDTAETALDFYFDPVCPWTWLTSRWLVDAARQRDIEVRWRSLSLLVLNDGNPPPRFADRVRASARAHRVIAALAAAGRNDLVGDLYTAIGRRIHDGDEPVTDDLVRAAADEVGAGAWVDALDDASWDEAVEASTREALDIAGPDVGSPILAHGTPRVGIFGPIVNPGPRGEQAARLLDLVIEASQVDGFFELKRGRTGGPLLPAPPAS